MGEHTTSQQVTVAGDFTLSQVKSAGARAWTVEVWANNSLLWSPQRYLPANFAAIRWRCEVDGMVIRGNGVMGGTTVPFAARYWSPLCARGTRLTVYGSQVVVHVQAFEDAAAEIATSPPMVVNSRIAPVDAPLPPIDSHLGYVERFTLPNETSVNLVQLPPFSREFRVFGGPPDSSVLLVTGSSDHDQLVDPYTGLSFGEEAGMFADWTPLHPFAVGVQCEDDLNCIEVR